MAGLVSVSRGRGVSRKLVASQVRLSSINGLIKHFRSMVTWERLVMREAGLSFWFGRVDVFRDPKNSRVLFAITIEVNRDLLSKQELAQLDGAPLREKACGTLIEKAQKKYPDVTITRINNEFPNEMDEEEGASRSVIKGVLYDLVLSVSLKQEG